MPTYISRRSSSSASPVSGEPYGKSPSEQPIRNTCLNSRPLDAWIVEIVTPGSSFAASPVASKPIASNSARLDAASSASADDCHPESLRTRYFSLAARKAAPNTGCWALMREDRAIGRLGPVGNQPGYACRHALCLFHIALISGSGNARAGFTGGNQFQVILTVRRGRKHPVGEVHDFRRRTIVGVEIDIGGERPEFIGETQQIPAGRQVLPLPATGSAACVAGARRPDTRRR